MTRGNKMVFSERFSEKLETNLRQQFDKDKFNMAVRRVFAEMVGEENVDHFFEQNQISFYDFGCISIIRLDPENFDMNGPAVVIITYEFSVFRGIFDHEKFLQFSKLMGEVCLARVDASDIIRVKDNLFIMREELKDYLADNFGEIADIIRQISDDEIADNWRNRQKNFLENLLMREAS